MHESEKSKLVKKKSARSSHASLSGKSASGQTNPYEPFLKALGDRIRTLRARSGMSRKDLSKEAQISERHLANLESGVGNASILILRNVSQALNCSLAELLGDETTSTPEWLLLRELLRGRNEEDLSRAYEVLTPLFGVIPVERSMRLKRIALMGLRGAGKSTLGKMLADKLQIPFVELTQEIERVAEIPLASVRDIYGTGVFHRYERMALKKVLGVYNEAVIAVPGSIVSQPGSFSLLLSSCYTVWVHATPEEHMKRVVAQGDFRPMHGSSQKQAMDDLRRILQGRSAFYKKADLTLDTSGQELEQSFASLSEAIQSQRQEPEMVDLS